MAARLAVPTVCLVLLCAVAIGVALAGPLGPANWFGNGSPQRQALLQEAALAGAAVVVAILTILLVASYARRLAREIFGLAVTAQSLADEQLPQVVAELREMSGQPGAGRRPGPATPPGRPKRGVASTRTAEIAAALTAIDSIERTAIDAATAEARLRDGLRQILMSLGRRNQSLLHRQLKIIDHLEQQAASPGELADLFALDHLTTRMRRHAESLAIMSGAAPVRAWGGAVPVIDVIRAAVAEIEDYRRVSVVTDAEESVAAAAVTDMIHLLAELIENATLFSPSATRVEVRADRVANGFAIEVEDRGLGIAPEQLREINARLASPPDFDLADADRLGLFVAGRLAARHGVTVELIPSAYRGTRAVVVLPESLVTTSVERTEHADGESVLRGVARLNVQSPEVLSLVGVATASRPEQAGGEPLSFEPERDAPSGLGELPRRDALPRRERTVAPGGPTAEMPPGMPAAAAGGAPAMLPRRARPGSPEQLASGTPVRMPGSPRPAEAPAPERARNLAASVQSSWQRSREADMRDMPGTDPVAPGGTPDGAPDSKEL
jgi:signal transduction histidine kinase